MDYDLVATMHTNELKNYLKVNWTENIRQQKWVTSSCTFCYRERYASENCSWSRGRFKEY